MPPFPHLASHRCSALVSLFTLSVVISEFSSHSGSRQRPDSASFRLKHCSSADGVSSLQAGRTSEISRVATPVLTAPVSAVPALFATVRAHPGPFPVKTASRRRAAGGRFDGTERAGTRSDGLKQGRNSADGCGEDRVVQCAVSTAARLPETALMIDADTAAPEMPRPRLPRRHRRSIC